MGGGGAVGATPFGYDVAVYGTYRSIFLNLIQGMPMSDSESPFQRSVKLLQQSEVVVSKPGALLRVSVYPIPEVIQRRIERALKCGRKGFPNER